MFQIRIRKFLGLPDPLVRGTDPDPFIIYLNKNSKKPRDFYGFVTFYDFLYCEELCKCSSKVNKQKTSYQNATDPEHCIKLRETDHQNDADHNFAS